MPEVLVRAGDQITAKIHYLEENPGGPRAILLIHGLGATCTSWPFQIPALVEAGYRVLAIDLPGFGSSTWSVGWGWSIRKIAATTVSFLEILQTGPVTVMGISMGGTVALQMALDTPEVVERLLLVNTFASLRPNRLNEWIYYLRRSSLLLGRGLTAQAEFVAWRLFPDPDQEMLRQAIIDQIRQSDEKSYQKAMLALGLFNVTGRLKDINVPTLVICGECDTTVPLNVQQQLAKRIPGAKEVLIQGGGHGVTADHPEEFNRVMMAFLQVEPPQAGQKGSPDL